LATVCVAGGCKNFGLVVVASTQPHLPPGSFMKFCMFLTAFPPVNFFFFISLEWNAAHLRALYSVNESPPNP